MPVQLSRRIRDFTDISLSFQANPVTGDITTLKNDRAIVNALKNCIMTATKEKPFAPFYGSVVGESLFELDDNFALGEIELEVIRAIEYNEPRVKVINVSVETARDAQTGNKTTKDRSQNKVFYENTVVVRVTYEIIGYEEIFNTEFILTPSTTL